MGLGKAVWGQDILRRRGSFQAGHRAAGQVDAQGRVTSGGLDQPALLRKGQLLLAVCLETGEVEWMELEDNSNPGTSAAFLDRLRHKHSGPLDVIWDNAPAHRGEAVREYLRTPGLGLRLMNLPGYSPDFNADEAVWGWAREEATGNQCLGTKSRVQEKVGNFLAGLSDRKGEVKGRCRTVLQSRAEGLLRNPHPDSRHQPNAHPTTPFLKRAGEFVDCSPVGKAGAPENVGQCHVGRGLVHVGRIRKKQANPL